MNVSTHVSRSFSFYHGLLILLTFDTFTYSFSSFICQPYTMYIIEETDIQYNNRFLLYPKRRWTIAICNSVAVYILWLLAWNYLSLMFTPIDRSTYMTKKKLAAQIRAWQQGMGAYSIHCFYTTIIILDSNPHQCHNPE